MNDDAFEVAKEKLESASRLLVREGVDTWLVLTRDGSDPAMPLLFGIESSGPAALFIRADSSRFALVPSSEADVYKASGLFHDIVTHDGDFETALGDILARLAPSRLAPSRLALDISESDHLGDGLTAGLYSLLRRAFGAERLAKAECSSEVLLAELRSVKSPTELGRMEEAIRITTGIYREVFEAARIGMTELDIAALFIDGFRRHGVVNGIGSPYDPPIVCIVRAGLAHRKPGLAKLEPGDILICDLSVKYRDYVSDIARTAYALREGERGAPPEVERAFRTAIEAINASIAALRPGMRGFEVDAAGRSVIEKAGYPTIRHSVGHQVGRNCHDGGTVLGPRRTTHRPEVEGAVRIGEIYAIEPTVIQDGGLPCMLVEEDVLVEGESTRVLSLRQKDLFLISERL